MDSLLVDLDKVLDDFEAEEDCVPGNERKPSGFQEYLEKTNEETWKPIDNSAVTLVNKPYDDTTLNLANKPNVNVMYDFPYEPENFDLDEADFAPSTDLSKGAYNGSLSYDKETTQIQMNGNSNKNVEVDKNLLGQYDLSNTTASNCNENINIVKNDLKLDVKVRLPVQADNSTTCELQESRVYQNGHVADHTNLLPKQNNQDQAEMQSSPQLASVPSSSSIDSNSDYDKFPVQCNTPQTPKDHPGGNPLDVQIAKQNASNSDKTVASTKPTPNHSEQKALGESPNKPNVLNHSSAVVSSQNTMQDIPRLQNLKSDLEFHAQTLITNNQTDTIPPQSEGKLNSQSLPASFHEAKKQNNTQNSLPMDLTSSQAFNSGEIIITKGGSVDDTSEVSGEKTSGYNPEVGIMTDHLSQQLNGFSTIDPKATNNTFTTGDINKPMVVGFGNEQDFNVDELDEYLGDNVPELDMNINNDGNAVPEQNEVTQKLNTFSEQNVDNVETRLVYDKTDIPKTEMHNIDLPTDMDTTEGNFAKFQGVKPNAGGNNSLPGENGMDIRDTTEKQMATVPKKSDSVFSNNGASDLEILKVLPAVGEFAANMNSKPVIQNLNTNLSPSANLSLDSGCASMQDNVGTPSDQDGVYGELGGQTADIGARPKDIQNKINRPNSLMGLSKVNLSADSPFVMKPVVDEAMDAYTMADGNVQEYQPTKQQSLIDTHSVENESRQLMETSEPNDITNEMMHSQNQNVDINSALHENASVKMDTGFDVNESEVELRRPMGLATEGSLVVEGLAAGRPHSWSPSDTGQPHLQKQKRPTSLNLPPQPSFNPNNERSDMETETTPEDGIEGAEASGGADAIAEEGTICTGGAEGYSQETEDVYIQAPPPEQLGPPPPYSSSLGKMAPKWVPDAEAPECMSCCAKFTFTKRRHHCRACGKVFCSTCCSMKSRLHYLNKDERVCSQCHTELAIAESYEASLAGMAPHPNNPGDYCSTGQPPHAANSNIPNPSVLVPVLKRDGGGRRNEPKQVMFSDGIRPGGDLTELDGRSTITRAPPRRSRVQKRVEKTATAQSGHHSPKSRRLRTVSDRTSKCLIPEQGLPPMSVSLPDGAGHQLQLNPEPELFMPKIKDEESEPVIFALNSNLYVKVKILNLDCCVNRVVWCFTTQGMTTVGQEEIVIVLETLPDETTIPPDIFTHLNTVYQDASKGSTIAMMGHSIFNQSFLGSRDHGGFLYIRATFQCVQKLCLPEPPYLFGILIQKWETPWAKVFPIRLLLRLGAEYRYYPCPLIGVRNRKPVFYEIGHTIMNLLADFRNYQYMLPNIRGISIHMEDKVTKINFPRNRYEDLMKVVNNSNEHVMAIGSTFSPEADSHLVCIQNEDGNYQTQAINIQNKPRKVTGASFVVFNGALKTSSGLSAKSSIVEDGLMVQITPDSMLALKQAMKDMQDYTVTCGVIGAQKPDETIMIQWAEDDKNVNIGVKSPVDSLSMDGIESLHIQNSPDYLGEGHTIRWTHIFFIQNEEGGSVKWDPVDLSRLGETLATASCVAFTPHLQQLKEASLTKIGLRVTLGAENVGYEAGAKGERLPDVYMNDLDNELIPVIHRATQHEGNIVLELIFQVLD